jgi:hypothetical protein
MSYSACQIGPEVILMVSPERKVAQCDLQIGDKEFQADFDKLGTKSVKAVFDSLPWQRLLLCRRRTCRWGARTRRCSASSRSSLMCLCVDLMSEQTVRAQHGIPTPTSSPKASQTHKPVRSKCHLLSETASIPGTADQKKADSVS